MDMSKHQVAEASAQYLNAGATAMEGGSTGNAGAISGDESVAAVPPGYKQTEAGVIPEDWELRAIDECAAKVGSGKTPTGGSSVYVDTGRVFIRSQNVGWGKLDLSDVAYITEETHATFTGSELQSDDVLLNITGASIGRCAKADNRIAGGNVNQHVCIIRTVDGKLNPMLLVDLINSDIGQKQIDSYQAGGNREGLNFSQVRNLRFAVASSKKEQIAIANALSDVDALINGLEKLIDKKQAIKTATMQQLLTGRTRLPQFAHHPDGTKKGYKTTELGEVPEDWETKTIGELSSVDPENLGSNTPRDYEFDYISLEQIDKGVLLGTTKCVFSNAPSRARRVLKKGDVVISTVRPNLMSHYYVRDNVKNLICSTGFSVVRSNLIQMVPGFLYQHLFSFVINQQIETLISGSNYPAINSTDVKRLKIMIGSVEEQTAIDTILSDMDEEIQTLQQRLSKTRQLKQGMMQELLTGKTRLVQRSAS